MTGPSSVDQLLDDIAAGAIQPGVFCDDIVFDATVPNWRYTLRGPEAVASELAQWYADPGHFEDLRRTPLPDGELIEFTLHWVEDGVPHACHQAHVVELRDGRIAKDTAWCGGRWPAGLLAQMRETTQT